MTPAGMAPDKAPNAKSARGRGPGRLASLTPRERVFLIVGGVFVGFTILLTFIIAPLAREWSATGAELERSLTRLEALQEGAARRDALLAKRHRLVARLGHLLGAEASDAKSAAKDAGKNAPPNPASTCLSLETYLERTAKKADVKIKRISAKRSPSDPQGIKNHHLVAREMSFESNIQNLIKLLHALEKGHRLVRIQKVTLRRNLKKGEVIDASIEVIGYGPGAREP